MSRFWQVIAHWLAILILATGGLGAVLMFIGMLLPHLFSGLSYYLFGIDREPIDAWYFFMLAICLISVGLMVARYSNRLPHVWSSVIALPFIIAVVFVFVAPNFTRRSYPRSVVCTSYQRQIALSIQMYAQEHEGKLPQNFTAIPYLPAAILICPGTRRRMFQQQGGYGYNAKIAGTDQNACKDAAHTPLTADSRQPGMLMTSSADIDFTHHRYGKQRDAVISFLDGHVTKYTEREAVQAWQGRDVTK